MTSSTLPRSSPSAQGVDAGGILSFLDALAAEPGVEMHSMMLLRHGAVVAEGWWAPYAPDRPHLLYSLSKSFTSTALGFAVAEGLVDLDDTVVSHFPEIDAEITDPRSRRILVRHVAAMASGHLTETLDRAVQIDTTDLVRGFLLIPPDEEPGSVFAYNQPCTFSIAAIIQRAAGMPLTDYLRPRLFDPLGIGEVGWFADATGRHLGFSGFHATTDAVARLGQLYLQGGAWNGRQLLSSEWVENATRSHVANPGEENPDWSQGYGFQFWMARHGYRGDGAYGQFCIVLPEQDAVLAITGQSVDMQAVLTAAWDLLLPAMAPSVSRTEQAERAERASRSEQAERAERASRSGQAERAERGSQAERALADRLTSARLPAAAGSALHGSPRTFAPRDGKALPAVTALTLTPGPDRTIISLTEGGAVFEVEAGHGRWIEGDAVAASGGVGASGELGFDVIFLETPHRLRIECEGGSRSTGTFLATWVTHPLHPVPLAQMRMPRA